MKKKKMYAIADVGSERINPATAHLVGERKDDGNDSLGITWHSRAEWNKAMFFETPQEAMLWWWQRGRRAGAKFGATAYAPSDGYVIVMVEEQEIKSAEIWI